MMAVGGKTKAFFSSGQSDRQNGSGRVHKASLFARLHCLFALSLFFCTPQLLGQDTGITEETSGLQVTDEQPDSPQDDDSFVPAPKKKYMGRRIAPTMGFAHAGWLIRDERQQEEDTQQAIENLGLKPGMMVCDMGCGNGYYSLEIAKRVGPMGKVFAVDIQQEMLHLLHLRADESKVDNIQTILGTVVDPQLPKESIDLLLMVDVYHEFSHPRQMLAKIRESLAPKGRIALIEFRAEDPRVPILAVHKMTKRQILREFEANGFQLVEQYDQLPWQHLMFFGKEDSDTKE